VIAENADEFTKRRLLDLAANYDKRLAASARTVTSAKIVAEK
jgi:hypothetical protein